jgi:endonuclease/exonuclease/phosphatase family metal-dependent hydrolase
VREDKGNAILSTLPLSDFIGIEAPMVAQRRISAGATVYGPRGDSLRLVSVHINTFPGPWQTLWSGASSRVTQSLSNVDALRRAELERAGAARDSLEGCYPYCGDSTTANYLISTIAAGDFNTGSDRETALLHLWENFPDSPPSHGQHTTRSFPTDHVLFRHNYQYASGPDQILDGIYGRLGSKYNSDHYPVLTWFKFGE